MAHRTASPWLSVPISKMIPARLSQHASPFKFRPCPSSIHPGSPCCLTLAVSGSPRSPPHPLPHSQAFVRWLPSGVPCSLDTPDELTGRREDGFSFEFLGPYLNCMRKKSKEPANPRYSVALSKECICIMKKKKSLRIFEVTLR